MILAKFYQQKHLLLQIKVQADQTYTFVYGEDYQVNIPKGYKLIKDVEAS